MSQTADCVIQVQDHKISTSVFFFLKFSTCCRNTNLDYTIQTISYYFAIECSKLRKWLNTVRFTQSPDPRIADPGLGSGPKSGSGLNRWHQSGGTDPQLVAGSHPDCVTTNQDRDTTYVGTGPDQLPLASNGKEKWPILLDRQKERDSHTKEHI